MPKLESLPNEHAAPERDEGRRGRKVRWPRRIGTVFILVLAAALFVRWRTHRCSALLDPSVSYEEITVRDWQLIGPFRLSRSALSSQNLDFADVGLDRDFLGQLGYPEAALNPVRWKALSSRSDLWRRSTQPGTFLLFEEIFPKVEYAVVYAAAEVTSAAEGDVALAVGSDDAVKVWLNGQLVVATPSTTRRSAAKYQNVVVVHVRRGSNFLLAKVDQKQGGWALVVNLLMPVRARRESAEYHRQKLVVDRFPVPGQSLELDLPLMENGRPASFSIQDRFGKEISSRQVWPGSHPEIALRGVEEGYYTCTLRAGTEVLRDEFYLGDARRVFDGLAKAKRTVAPGSRAELALAALIERYTQLNKPGRMEAKDINWQKKMLLVLRDAAAAIASPSSVEWFRTPGAHLRSFVSSIDGQPRQYLLYVPRKTSSRLPLVLVMPPNVEHPRPFLESILLWDAAQLESYARAAEEQGMALALIDGRGNTRDAPIGEADAFEALEDVRRDFTLDDERLYVYGVCEGGRRALLLAEHHPDLFAAVGTDAAVTSGYRNSPDASVRLWSRQSDARALVGNLLNVPLMVAHGDEDTKVPVSEATGLYDAARAAHCRVELRIMQGSGHQYLNIRPETVVFPFLALHRAARAPKVVRLTALRLTHGGAYWIRVRSAADTSRPVQVESRLERGELVIATRNVGQLEIRPERLPFAANGRIRINWNGKRSTIPYGSGLAPVAANDGAGAASVKKAGSEGPVFEALAGPFLVVAGTGGSPAARQSADQAAAAFVQGWQSDFFVACRMKRDTAVAADDLKAYHLVLFGEPSTGGELARSLAQLPISSRVEGLIVGEKWYPGRQLTYVAVFPNPLNTDRYLVVVGSNSERWALPDAHLALRGCFDFAVWGQHGRRLDSGLFDRRWKRAASARDLLGELRSAPKDY